MRGILATFIVAFLLLAVAPAQTWFVSLPMMQSTPEVGHQSLPKRASARHHLLLRVAAARTGAHLARASHVDGRPAQWCGWFLRKVLGVTDRAFNRALAWARWGRPSDGPQVGAVVVWRHHVGLIAGGPDHRGHWLVRSGNDGHAVRTRYVSLAHAIAFRMTD